MIARIYFFLFILFGCQLNHAQTKPEAVSLEEALVYGEQNNRNVQKASMEIQKAYKDKWSTIAIGLPQISASANYQNFIELPMGDHAMILKRSDWLNKELPKLIEKNYESYFFKFWYLFISYFYM